MAQLLIGANANVNQQCFGGSTPLSIASYNDHADIVALLLAQADIVVDLPDDQRHTALQRATASNDTRILHQLIDANANVAHADDCGSTALLEAARYGNLAAVNILVQHNASVNDADKTGRCSLFWAAYHGSESAMMKLLLTANAVVDLPDTHGFTPFLKAAERGHLQAVQQLLAAGANPHHRSRGHDTALHRASTGGHDAIVGHLLLHANADPNALNKAGAAALSFAARHGHTGCMTLLLDAHADIDAADQNGDTALIAAVMKLQVDAAKLLLQRGADCRKKGYRSAKQWSRQGTLEIRSLFQCLLCGHEKSCCKQCRKKYCSIECDKFSGIFFFFCK